LLAEQGDVGGARAAYQQAIDSGQPAVTPAAAQALGNLLAQHDDVSGLRTVYQQRIASRDPDRGRTSETSMLSGADVAVSLAWFPAGQFEHAIVRWPRLAEEWGDIAHRDYCHRLDGHMKWMRRHGVRVHAVSPIVVDDYIAWCRERDEDPDNARALYATERFADGHAIAWPTGRNEHCWCGSGRKYKKCCEPSVARPHAEVVP